MSMSQKKCCVPGCWESGKSHRTLHPFPNPEVDKDRFNSWLFAIGGDIISLDNEFIYKQRRVCRAHFEEKYLCRSNRISNIALPTLNIPGYLRLSKFSQVARRPLGSIQCTSEALPSTSADLHYNFLFEDEVKENFAPAPDVSYKTKDTLTMDVNEDIEDLKTVKGAEVSQQTISTTAEQRIVKIGAPALHVSDEAMDTLTMDVNDDLKTVTGALVNQQTIVTCAEKSHFRIKGQCKEVKSRAVKRQRKCLAEQKLYKKIEALRSKLSKCRKRMKVKSASLKAAKKITSNPDFVTTLEKLPIPGKTLLLMQIREAKKKDKGRRFNFEEKITALSIFKRSPKGYRFLRQMFILPAPQTLTKLLSLANISPGINKKTFKHLKKVSQTKRKEDRLCVLLFDEVALQANVSYRQSMDKVMGFVTNGSETKPEFADHAQVFMIRGLIKNYKQAICYTFAQAATKGTELAIYIKNIIKELDEAGFHVVATVCDQGSNNRQAIKILTQETKALYLRKQEIPKENIFVVNNREIVPLFDPPHLIKCMRNNLLTKDLRYKNINGSICTAKWDHIMALHKENPGYKNMRLIPKLTDSHVLPHKIPKMKVKYATQIFSRKIATNMGFFTERNILPKECTETADLLLFFDDLFDSVNGSHTRKQEAHGKPLLGSAKTNSCHKKFWYQAKKQLQEMNFINKSTGKIENVPTLKNWAWTLDGIIVLLDNLKNIYNITSIWMRHLNQDPLENFFGAIRSHGCQNTNPTPDRFCSAYTTLIINNMSSAHAPGTNCEKDLCENLKTFITPIEGEDNCKATPPACILEDIPDIHMTNLEDKSDPRHIGPLHYVTGYFGRNLKKYIFKSCSTCTNDIIAVKPSIYIKYREYTTGRQWLCSPTESLLKTMSAIQDINNSILKNELHKDCIKELIKTIVLMHVDFDFLQCNEHKNDLIEYLLEHSTTFFIFNYCKIINNIITGRRDPDDDDDSFQIKAKKHWHKCYKRKIKK